MFLYPDPIKLWSRGMQREQALATRQESRWQYGLETFSGKPM